MNIKFCRIVKFKKVESIVCQKTLKNTQYDAKINWLYAYLYTNIDLIYYCIGRKKRLENIFLWEREREKKRAVLGIRIDLFRVWYKHI